MKKLLLFPFLAALLAASIVLAQGSGTVEGDVANGSRGDEPVPGITVTLHVFDAQGVQKASLTTVTDSSGRFSFKGVDADANLLYVAAVSFEGIVYRSPALSFAEGQTNLYLPVLVYEPTESDSDILIQKAHFILNPDPAAKVVSVMEMYSVANNGLKALKAREGASLRFPLPPEARGFNSDSLSLVAGEAVYVLPVLPGTMPRPLVLEYSLPVQGDSLELRRRVPYPVESYNILVADVGISVEAPGTQKGGRAGQGGQSFLNFAGEKLPKDGEVTVKLSGFGRAGRAEGGGFGWAAAVAVAVALALFGLLAAYPVLRRR